MKPVGKQETMADPKLVEAMEILKASSLKEEEVNQIWFILLDQYSYGYRVGHESARKDLITAMQNRLTGFKNDHKYCDGENDKRWQKTLDEAKDIIIK